MSVAQIGTSAFTLWKALPITLSLTSLVAAAVRDKIFAPERHPEGFFGPNPTHFQIGYADSFEAFLQTKSNMRTGEPAPLSVDQAEPDSLRDQAVVEAAKNGDLAGVNLLLAEGSVTDSAVSKASSRLFDSLSRICLIFKNKMRCIG